MIPHLGNQRINRLQAERIRVFRAFIERISLVNKEYGTVSVSAHLSRTRRGLSDIPAAKITPRMFKKTAAAQNAPLFQNLADRARHRRFSGTRIA